METFKRMLSIFLRIAISTTLLAFLFRQVDTRSLWEIVKGVNIPLLILAFCIFFIGYVLCLLRWEMLLRGAQINLSFKRVIISFCGGIFFSLFLPSTIGGDLVRSVDLAVHTKKPGQVVATVILDRLSGYVGLVTVALVALWLGRSIIQDKSVIIAIVVITAFLIAFLLVLFNTFIYSKINKFLQPAERPMSGNEAGRKSGRFNAMLLRLRELLKTTHQEIHYFRNHKKIIVMNLLISLLIQGFSPLVFYSIALSLGVRINLLYFYVFLPVIGAITLLPISIGGLGLRDAMIVFFFAQAGVDKNAAFAMSLLNFFLILLCAGIGGLIYVLTVRHRRI